MHNPAQQQNKAGFAFFIAFSILPFFLLTWMYVSGVGPLRKGELAGPDCYMRLVRVAELYNTGQWYDVKSLRSNAPYGETLHWTKPLDCILLAGAIPLSHIIGFRSALLWWAVVLPPLMMTLTLIVLHFSIKPLVSYDASYLILCVFAFQPVELAFFRPGRSDHHCVLLFLFVISLGVSLRMFLKPFAKSWCLAAGVLSALAIWINIESILLIGTIIAVLSLFWILGNEDFAKKSLFYTLALFTATAINLLIERPLHDLASVEYDRLSIVYLTLFGLTVSFWVVVSALGSNKNLLHRPRPRFFLCLAASIAAAFVMLLAFPRFFRGPYANADPRALSIWLTKVSEVKPVFDKPFEITLPLLGSAVLSFAFLFRLLLKGGHPNNQKGWLFFTMLLIVFFTVSLFQIRFVMYGQTLLCIVIAEIISRTLSWLRKQGTGPLILIARLATIIILSTGFSIAGLFLDIHTGYLSSAKKLVHLSPLCAFLNNAPQWQGKTLRILANVFHGPEILYRTRYEVIATPYHRNGRAIIDSYNIMTAETDDKARSLIDSRGITTILLCPFSKEEYYYSVESQKSTFYTRLSQGSIPDWLTKVDLPPDLSSSFLLFEIKQPQ